MGKTGKPGEQEGGEPWDLEVFLTSGSLGKFYVRILTE